MPWNEISDYLMELNCNSRNNLVVLMLSCYGANLLRTFAECPVAPFRCGIGPGSEIKSGEIEDATTRFYRKLLKSDSIYNSFEEMFERDDDPNKYQLLEAEGLILNIWGQLKTQSTGKGKKELIEHFLTRLTALDTPLPQSVTEMRRVLKKEFSLENRPYSKLMVLCHRFLMTDKYPELRETFSGTLNKIESDLKKFTGKKVSKADQ